MRDHIFIARTMCSTTPKPQVAAAIAAAQTAGVVGDLRGLETQFPHFNRVLAGVGGVLVLAGAVSLALRHADVFLLLAGIALMAVAAVARREGLVSLLPLGAQHFLLLTSIVDLIHNDAFAAFAVDFARKWGRVVLLANQARTADQVARLADGVDAAFIDAALHQGMAHWLPAPVRQALLPEPEPQSDESAEQVTEPGRVTLDHALIAQELQARDIAKAPRFQEPALLPALFASLALGAINIRKTVFHACAVGSMIISGMFAWRLPAGMLKCGLASSCSTAMSIPGTGNKAAAAGACVFGVGAVIFWGAMRRPAPRPPHSDIGGSTAE